ncbi:MAG: Peptidase inhibitor, partial [Acidobacteriota bacterium]
MSRFYAFTLVVAALLSVAGASLLGQSGANRRAAGDYIVVFHDDEPDVDGTVAEHQRAYGASVAQSYRRALKGYAATIPLARVDDIRRDPRVAFVSPDRA